MKFLMVLSVLVTVGLLLVLLGGTSVGSLGVFGLPVQKSYREWTGYIEQLDFGHDVTVIYSKSGRSFGLDGASGNSSTDVRTFNYGFLVQTELTEDELYERVSAFAEGLNADDDGSGLHRYTGVRVYSLEEGYSGGLFDEMITSARQTYSEDDGVWFVLFYRLGLTLLIN